MEKYCTAGQATDDNMANAHCMLDTKGYKHTLRICNTSCFSTARTRLSVTLHAHCLFRSVRSLMGPSVLCCYVAGRQFIQWIRQQRDETSVCVAGACGGTRYCSLFHVLTETLKRTRDNILTTLFCVRLSCTLDKLCLLKRCHVYNPRSFIVKLIGQ